MKNKNNNVIKFLFNVCIILIVLIIVLYFSLKDNYSEIITSIKNMNPIWSILAILILVIYRALISFSHYQLIINNNEKIPFYKCLQINFIILFFHGVTPFATGGQPMEIYFLHKEGIRIPKATNITLQNFIVYQIALVTTGIFSLIYNAKVGLFPNDSLIKRLVILGFIINFLVLVITYLISFSEKMNSFILNKCISFLYKVKIIKNKEEIAKKLKDYLDNFHENAKILKQNPQKFLSLIIINILGLCILYSMPYIIALGLGKPISLLSTIVATAYVMIIGSFVPIPGGTGGIEYGFMFFFQYLIKGHILNATMLLWRFISYYIGVIIGAVALAIYRKDEDTCE